MNKIKNKFNCPKALWNKMSAAQQKVYNILRTYQQDLIDPKNYCMKDGWDVISHNFAYLAAQEIKY